MARRKKDKAAAGDDIPLFDIGRVPAPEENGHGLASSPCHTKETTTASPSSAGGFNDNGIRPETTTARTGQSPVPTKRNKKQKPGDIYVAPTTANNTATACRGPTTANNTTTASPSGAGGLNGNANGTHSRPLTVGQLADGIRDVLETCLSDVWVVGQVSGLKQGAGGHLYFDLKDAAAVIGCIMFASAAGQLRTRLDNGTEVIARGRVDFYPKNGRCSLIVTFLELRGVGALEIKFRQMKERLEKEGLFAPERKKPLPPYPQTIAVVTSPTGAAIRDIFNVLGRRWPAVRVLLYPVAVQGPGAAEEIARAVRNLDRHLADEVDVVIVGRGGGSAEDLWAFNEEIVARAIAACRIPVVSAVGHETDFSISDFVADVRAATPSAAAELVVPDRRQLVQRVRTEARRLAQAADHVLMAAQNRLSLAAQHRFFKYPEEIAGRRAARLDEIAVRLETLTARRLHEAHRRLNETERRLAELRPTARLAAQRVRLAEAAARHHAAAQRIVERTAARVSQLGQRLEALGPLAVLARGYSITLSAKTGRPVRNAGEVAAGDELRTMVASREEIRSKVE